MIIDSNIYPWRDTAKWSFRSFMVREFHYEEPPNFGIVGTDLDGIKWRYGMSFKIDNAFSLLTFDFDVIVSFPDRDTKILMDYVKMRETTQISLLGVEPFRDDTNAI